MRFNAPNFPFRSRMMTYLTCTNHRSYQRKHIDVCRKCPDNDECDAFQAIAATEPLPAPSMPPEATFPIHLFLQELKDIRVLVTDASTNVKAAPASHSKDPFKDVKLVNFIRSELKEIRKLCSKGSMAKN